MLALCEHQKVNVISITAIKSYAAVHAEVAEELMRYKSASLHLERPE